jgi:hypothetical protein
MLHKKIGYLRRVCLDGQKHANKMQSAKPKQTKHCSIQVISDRYPIPCNNPKVKEQTATSGEAIAASDL